MNNPNIINKIIDKLPSASVYLVYEEDLHPSRGNPYIWGIFSSRRKAEDFIVNYVAGNLDDEDIPIIDNIRVDMNCRSGKSIKEYLYDQLEESDDITCEGNYVPSGRYIIEEITLNDTSKSFEMKK